jgi:UDP-N-acetylglucosamine acyltransferase
MTSSKVNIHPTAIVDSKAKLGDGVSIGPYSIVEGNVTIGANTVIGAHCVVTGHTIMGQRNRVFTGAIIGSEPQDVKYRGETCYLEIGDDNYIREYVTINPGTGEESKTIIGNDNWFMIQTHVGHNCVLGSHIKLANLATLGGHVQIEDHATVGGVTPVHQFVRIGCYAMIGGGFRAVQDVVPYMIAGDEPLRIFGVNQIGLERNNLPKETIETLKKAHKIIFRSNFTLKEAIHALLTDFPQIEEVKHLCEFLSNSTRGIVR